MKKRDLAQLVEILRRDGVSEETINLLVSATKSPNQITTIDELDAAYQSGKLTLAKSAVRDAAKILYELLGANRVSYLHLFSRVVQNE